ncbi:MAG: EAL domain-containing protein [Acidiferrobacterales bacterium]
MIKIIFADSSPDDVEQCIRVLRQGKQTLKTQRVEDAGELNAALSGADWNIVLAAHNTPRLSPHQVLEELKAQRNDLPMIVLATKITDAELHEIMSDGAGDVIIRGQWGRLIPALQRELRAADARRASARTTEVLRRLEDRYRVMIEGSREAVCYCHDGMYVDANPAYLALVGYHNLEELKGVPVLNLIDKKDQGRFKSHLRTPDAFKDSREYTAITTSSEHLPVEIAMSAVNIESEPCLQIVVTNISKRKALESKLQFLHQRDTLTGLCNRAYFLQEAGKAIEQVQAGKNSCFLIGLELLGIKDINEAFGHATCDRILLMLTRQLGEHVTEQHVFGRVGGGQFAILLCGVQRDAAEELMTTLRKTTTEFKFSEGAKRIEFSFGLNFVEISKTTDDRQQLLSLVFRHPEATPTREHAPRPQTAVAAVTPESPAVAYLAPSAALPPVTAAAARATPVFALDAAVKEAISQERYRLLFQPLINLHGEPREYYEACLCLQTEAGDIIQAAMFMPAIEQSDLASKIDRWVAQHAIEALANSARQGSQTELFISLSASAVNDQMLLPAIQQHLKTARLNPAKLHFQVASSVLRQHEASTLAFFQQARKIGAGTVLDDFNPKQIGAPELADLPVDVVKINCALPECADEAMLRRAASDAKSSGKTSVAKHVEDMGVFGLLWNCGLDYVQGDSMSPPGDVMDFNFGSEQTLTSEKPLANPWQATA